MLRLSAALGRGAGQGPDQREMSDDSLRGRAVRFGIAGGTMSVFYVALTTSLALIGLPFQAALIISFLAAVALHFTFQRVFVWSQRGEYALPISRQLQRYLPLVAVQYVTTAAATATLPRVLGLPVLSVYVGIAFAYSLCNFLLFRARIFHVAADPRVSDGQHQ